MRKNSKRLATLAIAVLMMALSLMVGSAAAEEAMFTPGTYRAEGMGHNAKIVVDVTVSENAITDIVVVEERESKSIGDYVMKVMGAEMIERQSLNVDALSGATVTGSVFRYLVTDAVKQAGGDVSKLQTPAEKPVLTAEDLAAETDVVIVGAGVAGLAAAKSAYDEGLNVILLEQLGILGGSGARANAPCGGDTTVQERFGITFTQEDFYNVLTAPLSENLHEDLLDLEYSKGLSVRATEHINWLDANGAIFGLPMWGYVHTGPDNMRTTWSIVMAYKNYMDENGIEYRTDTKATELLVEGDTVVGVKAVYDGIEYEIKADAVIIATGSYLANKEKVAQYMPGYENNGYDVTVGCDGSGLDMALEVGAVAKHMDIGGFHALASFYNGVSRSLTSPAAGGAIAVNGDAVRYANESGAYADLTAETMKQDEVYMIMDQAVVNTDLIQNDIGLSSIMEMYVIRDTIEELAVELGLDPVALRATVDRYADFVRNGVDEDFGKVNGLSSDFSEGPYYGLKAAVENHTIYGGIVIDNDCRVLREDNSVIKGLYAAGEVAMSKIAGRSGVIESIDTGALASKAVKADFAK